MPDRDSISDQILNALRDHGLAAAIGVWFTFVAGLAAAVTRKAFTNEALLHKCRVALKSETRRVRLHFLPLIVRFDCHRAKAI